MVPIRARPAFVARSRVPPSLGASAAVLGSHCPLYVAHDHGLQTSLCNMYYNMRTTHAFKSFCHHLHERQHLAVLYATTRILALITLSVAYSTAN